MRSGFSVWRESFLDARCPFPRKLPRSTTCSFRVATLLRLETLAEYSRNLAEPQEASRYVGGEAGSFFRIGGQGFAQRPSQPARQRAFFAGGRRMVNRAASARRDDFRERAVAHACVSNKRPPAPQANAATAARTNSRFADSCSLWDAPLNQAFCLGALPSYNTLPYAEPTAKL